MTITSVGYAGTVGDSQWANMVSRVGNSTYSVDDFSSFKLAPTTGTRAATVSAGSASGYGIYDTSNATATINFASVSSGSRWDLVVLRRTWATKVTAIAIVTGGSSKAIPTRTNTPGTVDEQPLYLVNVVPGSALGEIVDLRCIAADAGLLAFDLLARSYLSRVGTKVQIGNTLWSRVVDTLGSAVWQQTDVTPDTGWVDIGRNDGFIWGFASARRIGSMVSIRINASRAVGWNAGNQIAYIASGFRPDMTWYVSSSASAGNPEWQINPDGSVSAAQNSGGSTVVTLFTTFPAAQN